MQRDLRWSQPLALSSPDVLSGGHLFDAHGGRVLAALFRLPDGDKRAYFKICRLPDRSSWSRVWGHTLLAGRAFGAAHVQPLRFFRHPAVTETALACLVIAVVAAFALHRIADRQNDWVQELLSAFLNHIPDNVYFKDRRSRFVLVSRAMASYLGIEDPNQAVGKTDYDFFSSEHALKAIADEKEIMRTGHPVIGVEEKETWPDGRETWVLSTKVALRNRQGHVIGTMGISHNITERKRVEAQIQHLATHDPLTGLPNRAHLKSYLAQSMARARAAETGLTVILLDLDRFKEVNDSKGHQAGDLLLEAISDRLRSSLRESDYAARLGGDEFVLVLSAVSKELYARQIANKVLSWLLHPFSIQGSNLSIGASIGIALFPQNGLTPEELLHAADSAMYAAKAKGGGCFCFSAIAPCDDAEHNP